MPGVENENDKYRLQLFRLLYYLEPRHGGADKKRIKKKFRSY